VRRVPKRSRPGKRTKMADAAHDIALPTLGEALAWARQRIDPLDARILLAHAARVRTATLLAYPERTLPEEAWRRFRDLVTRRAAGEPVAYLTGEREFYGRTFHVSPAVLIPRPDTETLVDVALAVADQRAGAALRILDLGTGSGCIAITLALELPHAEVVAVDRSRAALLIAMRSGWVRASRSSKATGFLGWGMSISTSSSPIPPTWPRMTPTSTKAICVSSRGRRWWSSTKALRRSPGSLQKRRVIWRPAGGCCANTAIPKDTRFVADFSMPDCCTSRRGATWQATSGSAADVNGVRTSKIGRWFRTGTVCFSMQTPMENTMSDVQETIRQQIASHPVVLYMKGTPQFPMCGFSATVVHILDLCGVKDYIPIGRRFRSSISMANSSAAVTSRASSTKAANCKNCCKRRVWSPPEP